MSKEKEADLNTEPLKVVFQEAKLLFERASPKFKMDYIYHWNRLLIAIERIQK